MVGSVIKYTFIMMTMAYRAATGDRTVTEQRTCRGWARESKRTAGREAKGVGEQRAGYQIGPKADL